MTLDIGWPEGSKCVVERHSGSCLGMLRYEKCDVFSTFNETRLIRRTETSSIDDKFKPVVERRRGLLRIFDRDMKAEKDYLATLYGKPIIVTKDKKGIVHIYEAIPDD